MGGVITARRGARLHPLSGTGGRARNTSQDRRTVTVLRLGCLVLLLAATAVGQQLQPNRAPQPQLPSAKPPAAAPAAPAPAPATSAPPPAPAHAKPAAPSPAARANALPGQQFTPRHQPWVTHNFSPARARHDLKVAHFYSIQHNYVAALSRAKGALRHYPHWPPALYAAGRAAARLHRWPLARQYWREYLRRAPHGKKAKDIRKALRRLPAASAKPAARH